MALSEKIQEKIRKVEPVCAGRTAKQRKVIKLNTQRKSVSAGERG